MRLVVCSLRCWQGLIREYPTPSLFGVESPVRRRDGPGSSSAPLASQRPALLCLQCGDPKGRARKLVACGTTVMGARALSLRFPNTCRIADMLRTPCLRHTVEFRQLMPKTTTEQKRLGGGARPSASALDVPTGVHLRSSGRYRSGRCDRPSLRVRNAPPQSL